MAAMTPEQYAHAWEKRARDYKGSLAREMRAIGALALSVSDRLMTMEIYSKPEDTWPSGKPKWRRTNLLAVSETQHMENGDMWIVLENDAPYAEPRHEANKPGRRQINPARTAHWRDDMITILGRAIPDRIRRLSLSILRST